MNRMQSKPIREIQHPGPTGTRRIPRASFLLFVVSAVAFFIPGLDALLEYNRPAMLAGQAWRALTGHFAHWSFSHWVWDAAVFAGLGVVCESISGRGFLRCVGVSMAAISLAVWAAMPGMDAYRGLSGVDSALFGMLAAWVLRTALRERRWTRAIPPALFLVGFLAKLAFEFTTQSTIFVQSAPNVYAVPLAHLVGLFVGIPIGIRAAGDYAPGPSPNTILNTSRAA